MPGTREQLEQAAADAAAWIESLDPVQMEWRDATPLRWVAAALGDVADAEHRLDGAVRNARQAGFSLAAVGAVLGVSGEAVRQRYGTAVETSPAR
jgi:hypothetical protein